MSVYDANKICEAFTQYLTEKSLRKSTVRYMILEHICHIRGHFDVEMLLQQLDEHHFRVSRASIYNIIELLMDAGLIIRHQFSSQLVQYELKFVAATHHHAVCTYCGAVREFKNDKTSKEIANHKIIKFAYEYHAVYVYGICSKCKFRLNLQKRKK
jgi:Fur family ferric uptake transcriptional regulator